MASKAKREALELAKKEEEKRSVQNGPASYDIHDSDAVEESFEAAAEAHPHDTNLLLATSFRMVAEQVHEGRSLVAALSDVASRLEDTHAEAEEEEAPAKPEAKK